MAELAARIPFELISHVSLEKEHLLMYRNDALNINYEIATKMKNDDPGRSTRCFYVVKRHSKNYPSLAELFEKHPEVRGLAESLYPIAHEGVNHEIG